ncbi:hypothetical protein JYU34_004250 [Plutella xylostella]|uniref:Uncharacterized protein n=1 Tax=Plutella xylostella TaxID=51655 RepID=A0ABQ7QXH6_PLUXY|nr:hypothetical protein JYU34_004250 [Plutella xylostella]
MSPGERAALGRREPARPQYGATAPGFPPPYYPPYGVPHPNAWLGAPLISMASRAPPARQTPISKLAMHAQGAPLIIQNRYDRRKFTTTPEQRHQRPGPPQQEPARDEPGPRRAPHPPARARPARNHNADAVSVASDESSGSNNSETMLPRIIKPRKRRKKDRKPNNIVPHDMTVTNLDIGDVDHCGVSSMTNQSHGIYDETYCGELNMPYRVDVKVEYGERAPEPYRVAALGEALEATRFGLAEAAAPAESASSCQCRYCDPVGQIWDSDSIAHLLDENTTGDFAPTKLEDSMKVVGSMGRRGADATLRRSWSDPSSRVPMRKEVGGGEAGSAPHLYSLFPPARRGSSPHEPRSPLALEISSEIVTSINGHRDLEIKLFSTSPPASVTSESSFFAEKRESADGCAITTHNRKVNCAVKSDKVDCSVNKDDKYVSEDVALRAGASRKLCDLALVTA